MKKKCEMKRILGRFSLDVVLRISIVVLMLSSSSPTGVWGHMRGPHHPRNSPISSTNSNNGHNHNHYVPRNAPGEPAQILTHDKNLLHDKEHIKEDIGEWIMADGKDLSPEEMEFHYFKMHDFDNNSMLDGLEILQAISHVLPSTEDDNDTMDLSAPGKNNKTPQQHDPNPTHNHKALSREELLKQKEDDFNYYIDLIDKVLEEDDMNKDGYLSYFEYVVGRRREERKEKVLHSSNPT